MTLNYWLWLHRVKKVCFARHLGTTQQSVNHWCRGRSVPKRPQMEAIYRATGGQVTPDSFYDLATDEEALSKYAFPIKDVSPEDHPAA